MAENMTEAFHPIVIVGCGPGGPDFVTPVARQAVGQAQVLVGAMRLFDLFPESCAERIPVTAHIDGALERIDSLWRNKRVAVLTTGDPGLMSLAAPVIRRFGLENCRIIPGISALQVACARLGLDWQDLIIIDAHGSDPEFEPDDLIGVEKIAVFLGQLYSWINRLIKSVGDDYHVHLCENLTLSEEKITKISDKLPAKISSMSIVILIKEDLP
jgi:cobalt-precorrin-7 (C5)-methyltransferase